MRFEGFPYVQKPPVIADQSGYIGNIVTYRKTAIFVSTNHHTATYIFLICPGQEEYILSSINVSYQSIMLI